MPGVKDMVRQWRLSLLVHSVQHAVQPSDEGGVRTAGPAAYRVLLLGGGIPAGLGVSRRAVAVPGHVARHLTAITGRGAEIDVDACVGMTISDARVRAEERTLRPYDAVVLLLGVADALAGVPAPDWRHHSELLLAGILQRTSPTARVVVVGCGAADWAPYVKQAFTRGAERRVDEYNSISRELCWGLPRVSYLRLPAKQSGPEVQHTVRDHDRSGRAVAAHLAQRLERSVASAPSSGGDQAAANLMFRAQGLSDLPLDAVIDRVVARARSVFGVEGACLTLLREEGPPDDSLSEPSAVLAATSAGQSGGLAVRDLRNDPRFRHGRLAARHGMAFYAGYRVQAPTGDAVAVLSIFDPRPRTFSDQEMGILRDHALLIERALARGSRAPQAARRLDTLSIP